MPKNCRECPLAKNESIVLEEAYNCLPKRKWVTDRECESRQNWCPLKEVPQKPEFQDYMEMDGPDESNIFIDEIVHEEEC